MNVRDSEFDRLLAEWLEDDPFVAPANPVETAIAFARASPRRRDWLARLRRDAMTTRATAGLRPAVILVAVAALLVLAVGGAVVMGSDPRVTSVPIPTARPTPTATPSPTATPVGVRPLPPWGGGELEPGQYTVQVPDSTVTATITIGEGWTPGGWYIMNPPDFTKSVSFWTIGNVPTDACDWERNLPQPPIGPTVDDLVAALDAQANTDMSAPVDVVVDGYVGKRVRMLAPSGTMNCGTPVTTWVAKDGVQTRVLDDYDKPDTVWILDVAGQRVVIVPTSIPSAPQEAADVAAVMESLELTAN